MGVAQGVIFEKKQAGINHHIHIDMRQHAKAMQPFMQSPDVAPSFDGWEEGLSSEEFLTAAKQMLRQKFDGRNQVS